MLAANVTAQVTDDAPPDAAALDTQIAALAKLRSQKKTQYFTKIRAQIEGAIQTPGAAGNFVIECMRQVQFGGRVGGNTEFAEWKKKNRDLLSNRDFERAANLHLRYLALTLERETMPDAGALQPEIMAYLGMLNQSQDLVATALRDQGSAKSQLLNASVSGGVPARALKVDILLEGIPDWEMAPGNFQGIIEQDVRAYLRQKGDPRLVATWDSEIAYLSGLAKLKSDNNAPARFESETIPRLRWKQAKDVNLLGMPNRALLMEISVAKGFPEHPDFEQWTAEISAELKRRKAAAAPAEAIKSADAPASTGTIAPPPVASPAPATLPQ